MALLTLKTDDSHFTLEIGREMHVQGAQIQVYAGGNDYREGRSYYETEEGYVILEAIPLIKSEWGDHSMQTSLTARNSNVETVENISRYFQDLINTASSKNDSKNEQMAQWVQKQILDYYFKYSSTNARFEVFVACKSRQIKTPGGFGIPEIVIDTKTANLDMCFTFRILKLITPQEVELLSNFMKSAIENGKEINFEYADSQNS